MKKIKFFASIYKERDWLEEMAAQGYLFTDVTLGILYHFQETEPCEKVYEIEHFDTGKRAPQSEADARNRALELADAHGWTIVTQDGDWNYYFVKDKNNNGNEEFYQNEEQRRERAERFRKRHSYDTPISLLVEWLIISIFCMLILLMMLPILEDITPSVPVVFGLIYVITTITEIGSAFYNISLGQYLYDELVLSRPEWETRKDADNQSRALKKLKEFLTPSLLTAALIAGALLTGLFIGIFIVHLGL